MERRPHLELLLRATGRARLSGGGGRSKQTEENSKDPPAHAARIRDEASNAVSDWRERRQRDSGGAQILQPAIARPSKSFLSNNAITAAKVLPDGHGTRVASAVLYPHGIPRQGAVESNSLPISLQHSDRKPVAGDRIRDRGRKSETNDMRGHV